MDTVVSGRGTLTSWTVTLQSGVIQTLTRIVSNLQHHLDELEERATVTAQVVLPSLTSLEAQER